MSDSRYRPELDGIRAVAVLFVIVNHFHEGLMPSGFLGVDIFFVLSGYVVASSLAYRQSTSWHDFLFSFIARRIKRIVPALVACILIVSFAGCFFSPEVTSLWAAKYALFGVSNIFFLENNLAYFGAAARHNFFTHTWSLGVEEQFYLLFPWILILTGSVRASILPPDRYKYKRRLLVLLAALCAASIIAWIYLSSSSSLHAYFLMPARFWELGLGSLTFYLSEIYSLRPSARATGVLASTALASLVVIAFLPPEVREYSTIAICFATAATIWLLNENTMPVKLLSNSLLVGIGVLSYSLYLWHWPVLSLSRFTIGVSVYTVVPQIILIVLLAVASYRFIEKPFRYGAKVKSSKLIIIFGLIAVVLCSLWMGVLGRGLLNGKFLPRERFDLLRPVFSLYPDFAACSDAAHFARGNIPPPCFYSSHDNITSRPTLWMLGDSTTWALKPMASKLVSDADLNIIMFADDSSFPSKNIIRIGDTNADTARWEKNYEFYRKVYGYLLFWAKGGDIVLVTADLSREFCNKPELYCRNGDGTSIKWKSTDGELLAINEAFQRFLREMEELSSKLKQKNVRVIISAPLPSWERDHLIYCERQWFRPEWITNKCQFPGFKEQEFSRRRILAMLRSAESKSDLLIYDPFPYFCNSASCDFSDPRNNVNYWIDEIHLSTAGSERLCPHFLSYLADNALLEKY